MEHDCVTLFLCALLTGCMSGMRISDETTAHTQTKGERLERGNEKTEGDALTCVENKLRLVLGRMSLMMILGMFFCFFALMV